MQFYETHFDEYLRSVERDNFHGAAGVAGDEGGDEGGHLIFYGAPGIGKYTQVLAFLKPRSPSGLKYDKKIATQSDKDAPFVFRMSDVHFEVDMSLLGCNPKMVWHEIYGQIIDIVYSTSEKTRYIVCKNFHDCPADLLDIFYSYVDHKIIFPHISLRFIFVTTGLSFVPDTLLKKARVVQLRRPTKEMYATLLRPDTGGAAGALLDEIGVSNIANMKELKSFRNIACVTQIPKDIFNVTCDEIIEQMKQYRKMDVLTLRERLYDMLIYQLNISDCLWYILEAYLANPHWWPTNSAAGGAAGEPDLSRRRRVSRVVQDLFVFFKYYNNNYRPIYHLEKIVVKMINEFYQSR